MDRLTAMSNDSYELVGSLSPETAVSRLGEIEDMIESGELMTPDVKQDDTVFFIFKSTQILEGKVESIFTQYDHIAQKYFYHVVIGNDFYNLHVDYEASFFGVTWFRTRAEAETAFNSVDYI